MKLFQSVNTPLICQNECGSPTYGYIQAVYDWDENRIVQRIVCAGCDYVHSKEETEYLDSISYADDFIGLCFDYNSEMYNIHDYLNHFVNWLQFKPQRESLLMRMIEI